MTASFVKKKFILNSKCSIYDILNICVSMNLRKYLFFPINHIYNSGPTPILFIVAL